MVLTSKEVDELLKQIKLIVALRLFPVNYMEEKEKFFHSSTYNPVYQYKVWSDLNYDVCKTISTIERVADVSPAISQFYLNIIANILVTYELAQVIGDNEKFTALALQKYGKADEETISFVDTFLRAYRKEELHTERSLDRILYFDEIKDIFTGFLSDLGLTGWRVFEASSLHENDIRVGHTKIKMHKNITRTTTLLKKSIVHEIGTHVLRRYNGEQNILPVIGKHNTADYLDTEEGLALYNEELFDVLSSTALLKRVLLAWGIHNGVNMTFRELYMFFIEKVDPETAFHFVYRIKRGLTDTAMPGIYAKDLAYIRGYVKVKALIANDPSAYTKLYAGKITLKQIEWVEKGILHMPVLPLNKDQFLELFEKYNLTA